MTIGKTDFIVMGIFIAVMTIMLLFVNFYEEYRCNNYEKITGRESEWVFMDECYVKNDKDIWIRYDSKYKE